MKTDFEDLFDKLFPSIAIMMAIDFVINFVKFLNWFFQHVRIV